MGSSVFLSIVYQKHTSTQFSTYKILKGIPQTDLSPKTLLSAPPCEQPFWISEKFRFGASPPAGKEANAGFPAALVKATGADWDCAGKYRSAVALQFPPARNRLKPRWCFSRPRASSARIPQVASGVLERRRPTILRPHPSIAAAGSLRHRLKLESGVRG